MSSILTLIRNHARIAIIVISLCVFSGAVWAQDKPLEVRVDSVFGFPGQQNAEIPIYLNNIQDSVVAFKLWFYLEQPDLIEFNEMGDPVILSEGTLTEGWSISARSLGGQGHDIQVLGSVPHLIPPYNGLIPVQSGETPLFGLKADVYHIPDTTTDTVVNIYLGDQVVDLFQLLDNHGELIGVSTEMVPDTSFYRCLEWLPENENICLWWEQVAGVPYDSISVEDISVTRIDTDYIGAEDGSLTVLLCGDIQVDQTINLLDIIDFIDYKFKDGEAPKYLETADVNHDSAIDILDILALVDYKFKGGPAPACY